MEWLFKEGTRIRRRVRGKGWSDKLNYQSILPCLCDVLRRLRGKQLKPAGFKTKIELELEGLLKQPDPSGPKAKVELEFEKPLGEALQAEVDLADLAPGILRQHVHCTHVTADNPNHNQAGEFTRQGF